MKAIMKSISPLTRIYHMRHSNGLTKIGRSKDPKARERTLQAEDPDLKLIWVSDPVEPFFEKWWHDQFSDKRVRGEWFDLGDTELDAKKGEFYELVGDVPEDEGPIDFGADIKLSARQRTPVKFAKSPFWYINIHVGYDTKGRKRYSPRSTGIRIGDESDEKFHKRRQSARRVGQVMQVVANRTMGLTTDFITRNKVTKMVESIIQACGKEFEDEFS